MNRALVMLLVLGLTVSATGREPSGRLPFGVPWPPGSKAMADLQALARRLDRQTEGRVRLRFVEASELASAEEPLAGRLLAGPGLFQRSPAARVLGLPLLTRNSAEASALLAEFADAMTLDLGQDGWSVLAKLELGFAYLMAVSPVSLPDDLRTARLWFPAADPDALRVAASFGAQGVFLEPVAVREALRTGAVDAFVAPPLGAIVMQWHVEVRHLLDAPLMHLPGVVVMRSDVLERFAPADARLLRDELPAVFQSIAAEVRRQEPESLAVMKLHGATITALEGESGRRAAWEAWADEVADHLIQAGLLDAALLARARQVREALRATP